MTDDEVADEREVPIREHIAVRTRGVTRRGECADSRDLDRSRQRSVCDDLADCGAASQDTLERPLSAVGCADLLAQCVRPRAVSEFAICGTGHDQRPVVLPETRRCPGMVDVIVSQEEVSDACAGPYGLDVVNDAVEAPGESRVNEDESSRCGLRQEDVAAARTVEPPDP